MRYQKKLEYFLGTENEHAVFNNCFYREFYVNSDISHLFMPVEFFETVYAEYIFFYHNSSNYLAIVEHFKNLPYDLSGRYYIFHYLSSLIGDEYADKEMRGYIVRHEEVVLQSCAYITQLFKENRKAFLEAEKQKTQQERQVDELLWQYPQWNKVDFIANRPQYRQAIRTALKKNDRGELYEIPYYEITLNGTICARLLPAEYFGLLTYEVGIPQAHEVQDLAQRVKLLRKTRSDIRTHALNATTTNDIGRKYREFFDVNEMLNAIDIHIENVERAIDLNETDGQSKVIENQDPDFERAKQALLQEWVLLKDKTVDEITDEEAARLMLWTENIDIAQFLISSDSTKKLFKASPKLEIEMFQLPIEHFSKWYKDATEKVDFQKDEFIDSLVHIYTLCINAECFSAEADLVRLSHLKDYRKCITAIERLRPVKNLQKELAEPRTPEADGGNQLKAIAAAENKFWKGLPMAEVVKHFEVMTTRKNKTGTTYLTTEQLVSFLNKGFLLDQTQPRQKINCTNGEKGFVISRFYGLFDLAAAQYGFPSRKQKFIDLFLDCFDNWQPNTIATFFKPNKVKEKW